MPPGTIARLLRAEAARWAVTAPAEMDLAARIHATLALVGQACRAGGVDPLSAVQADLAELETRPYLAAYFAGLPLRDEATA